MRPIITLTTDFGLSDPFVGIMKGVILNILPEVDLIDITHQIRPQERLQTVLTVKAAWPYFPKNTVHLVVVDPGVGGTRRPLAVQHQDHIFIGPDNGVLTPGLQAGSTCYELTEARFFGKTISNTFHGRDVFAPAAAWAAKGTPLSEMGEIIDDPQQLDLPEPRMEDNELVGEVIYIDHFGNLITNIDADLLSKTFENTERILLRIGGRVIHGLSKNYSECEVGSLGGLINSWNVLEIFYRERNASEKLVADFGKKIRITAH